MQLPHRDESFQKINVFVSYKYTQQCAPQADVRPDNQDISPCLMALESSLPNSNKPRLVFVFFF